MLTYTPSPHIHWVIDANQTVVVNKRCGDYFVLNGIDAVIWSWLTLNYSYNQMLFLIEGLEQPQARRLFHNTLKKWSGLGLLIDGSD